MAAKNKVNEWEIRLRDHYENQDIELNPSDTHFLQMAANHLAEADSLDDLVRRDGRMIPGGNRAGMEVLHPAISEAREQRKRAAEMLKLIKVEEIDEVDPWAKSERQRRNATGNAALKRVG